MENISRRESKSNGSLAQALPGQQPVERWRRKRHDIAVGNGSSPRTNLKELQTPLGKESRAEGNSPCYRLITALWLSSRTAKSCIEYDTCTVIVTRMASDHSSPS
jgi:hypothetical protein